MKNPYSQSITLVGLGLGVGLPLVFIAFCAGIFLFVSGKIEEGERLLTKKNEAQSALDEARTEIRRFGQFAALTTKIAPASNIRTEFRDTLSRLEAAGITPAEFEALSSFSGTAPFPSVNIFAAEQIELNAKTRFAHLAKAVDVIETVNPQIFLRALSLRPDNPPPPSLSAQNPSASQVSIPRDEQPLVAKLYYIVVNLPPLPQ